MRTRTAFQLFQSTPLRFKPAREISIIGYNNFWWTLGQNVKQLASTTFFCSFSENPYCPKNRIDLKNDESSHDEISFFDMVLAAFKLVDKVPGNVAAKKVGRNKLENLVFKFFFIKYLYYAQGKRFTSRRDALDRTAATRYVVSSCGLLVHSA